MTWLIPDSFPRRFWAKVEKGEDDECWEWTASKNWGGYGTIQFDDKRIRAHRASWILHNGPIPDDTHVLHHCDNPGCMNPKHLYLGNHNDNMRDMVIRGRSAKGNNHSHAKLTRNQVISIRQKYSEGNVSQGSLAKRYGVCQSTICLIVNQKRWQHV